MIWTVSSASTLRIPTTSSVFRRLFGLALVLAFSACSARVAPTPLPTLTLIPATATPTSTPVTPTATPAILPRPGDFITPSPSGAVQIPAIAQPLINRALADLAGKRDISPDSIQLVRLESAVWTTIDLGCGDQTQTIAGSLHIDGFRIVLAVDDQLYEYHTDNRSSIRLCAEAGTVLGSTQDLLAETDPVAAGLVSLAQRRLSTALNLPARRIQVVDIRAYRWTDSSLGCPLPGQDYAPVLIDGYRIVMSAGDVEYIFHSDSEQLIACDARYERLPG